MEYFGPYNGDEVDVEKADLNSLIKNRSLNNYEKFLIFDKLLASIKQLHQ